MPSFNYDVYIEDKLVAIFFETETLYAFIQAIWETYSCEEILNVRIRKRDKGVAVTDMRGGE